MSVRLKTFLLLSVVLIVSIVAYVSWYSYAEKQRMYQELQALTENYDHAFHAEFQSVRERMLQLALFTANDAHMRELMAAAAEAVEQEGGGAGGPRAAVIRAELLSHLRSGMKELGENFDIVNLHFHLTPGALSFLRFHAPDQYGDRLDDIRRMVVEAGRECKPMSGFEIGRYFAGVRAAAPIFAPSDDASKPQCVGVVEFGTPMKSLLQAIHSNRPWLNAASFVYEQSLRRDMVSEYYATTGTDKIVSAGDGKRLQLDATTSPDIDAFTQHAYFLARLSSPHNFRFDIGDEIYNVAVLRLDDFDAQRNQDKPAIGRVVLWQEVSERVAHYRETRTSMIWYGAILFVALEGCIYLGLFLVSAKLKDELEHQRQLERVSGRALEAVSDLGLVEQQPQVQLNRILQEQLNDALEHLGAELGMFISARQADGEYRILAISDAVWTTTSTSGRNEQARNQLVQQGYIPISLDGNILVRALENGEVKVLQSSECSRDIIPFLPEGHPPIENVILVPVKISQTPLGMLVLANSAGGFGVREQVVAKAYAGAAALLMHSDLREVERLSALESARVKEDLFRNLNHELRTPLNVITSMCKNLEQTDLDRQQKHNLEQICSATRRLTRIVSEVLLLAEYDANSPRADQSVPFRPEALLESVVAEFEEEAQERGIELRCRCADDLPARILGDSESIVRILRPLVSNAVKFSRDAEVLLTLDNIGSHASTEDKGADYTLRFSVTDHGIGIAPEQGKRIFEPFYQCDRSRARAYEGAGLGLSVAHKLATLLGSEIKFESEVGRESTFYFDLKLKGCSCPEGSARNVDHPGVFMDDTEHKPQDGEIQAGDEAQLLALLRELESPLIQMRPQPCSAMGSKLSAIRWPTWIASEVDKIIKLLDKYRYIDTLDIVHKSQIQLEEYLQSGTDK
jgi:signal transduction histidine kinase